MSDIAATPTPGKQYVVKPGDWISRIARRAYGDEMKWPLIRDANKSLAHREKIGSEYQEYFHPGDVIFIPELVEERKAETPDDIPGKAPDDFALVIEGREIPVESGRVVKTIDTGADAWTAKIAWEPGADKALDRLTSPYGYRVARVYLGGRLQVDGLLYDVTHSRGKDGSFKTLHGFSYTADIIDSTVEPPYEANNVTILQRAKQLTAKFGIDVEVDDGVDIGPVFSRITSEQGEKIFEGLAKLASSRGQLLSTTRHGGLLITRSKTDAKPVGSIIEGRPLAQNFEISFKGRDRYATYKATAASSGKSKTAGSAVATDTVVTRPRTLSFTANDIPGTTRNAAEWKRNKILADSLAIPFPVSSWYAPDGNLWSVNTTLNVTSPTIGVSEFLFLIKQVEFIFEKSGVSAVVSLVPPAVYTTEKIEEPWLL